MGFEVKRASRSLFPGGKIGPKNRAKYWENREKRSTFKRIRKANKMPPKPSLDDVVKNFPPPVTEDPDMDYEDEDEEEELDLASELLPFEKQFYDEDGNFIEE